MIVHDKMQQDYIYDYSEPIGQNFSPDFQPELTPQEMLSMGIFEGHYMTDCQHEFPQHWFQNAKLSDKPDIKCNCFHIKSRQSLQIWQQKGWIIGPDVRGWFQWYCRYYMGRRLHNIDAIQIRRWKAFKRHKAQILNNCLPFDTTCRLRQRQALLQWAYNPFF